MLPTSQPDIWSKATESQVLQALASLAGLPSRQADDASIDQAMYFIALDGVSRFALSEAVKSIMRGGLGHTFFPSPVELRQRCDAAMEPHIRLMQRNRIREQQARENQSFAAARASRTPQSVARVSAAYARFCASYEQEKPVAKPTLDPELVAKLPDAPKTFDHGRVA